MHRLTNLGEFKRLNRLGRNLAFENGIYTDRYVTKLKTEEEDVTGIKPLSSREVKSMQFGETPLINLDCQANLIFMEDDFGSFEAHKI